MFPLRIRRPHVSWSNTLHKTECDDHSDDPSPITILDLTHRGPIVSVMKEDDYKPFRDAKADLKDYTRFTRLSKDVLDEIHLRILASPTPIPACIQPPSLPYLYSSIASILPNILPSVKMD
jgi:hypothetical protein